MNDVSSPGIFGGGSPGKEKGGKDKGGKDKHDDKHANGTAKAGVSGVFAANPSGIHKVTILNGSHRTVSDDETKETVLVFPDYKVVTEVEASHAGAEELWEHALSPSVDLHSVPRDAKSTVKSWIIPYACVILLCMSRPSSGETLPAHLLTPFSRFAQAARQPLCNRRAQARALYVFCPSLCAPNPLLSSLRSPSHPFYVRHDSSLHRDPH